ncbi:MAG: flagellar basal body rod protein FlgC [Deltaproteobacteria bacterium]|nr:flagellar basal body rod protein FlgC [Deltaproteobacteria bacterium]
MDLMQAIERAASGMLAQRIRLNVISTNLANANTTRTEDGKPYRRKTVIFETTPGVPGVESFEKRLKSTLEARLSGVRVREIVPIGGEFKKIYDPSHPDADENGFVYLPNVNLVEEMVNMLDANRAYEANAAVIKAAKNMALKAIELGR